MDLRPFQSLKYQNRKLEDTGHYSYNLLEYLIDKVLPTYIINPLHTNL